MAKAQPSPEPVANWVLSSLPRRDYEQLLPGQSILDQVKVEPDMFNPEMFAAPAPF